MAESKIKLQELEQLANLQCTRAEIAAFFGVSVGAVDYALQREDMREAYERGQKSGLISLRRAQFTAALKGNATMLIWLGKQLLGQREVVYAQHAGEVVTYDNRDALIRKLEAAAQRLAGNTSGGDQKPN